MDSTETLVYSTVVSSTTSNFSAQIDHSIQYVCVIQMLQIMAKLYLIKTEILYTWNENCGCHSSFIYDVLFW